MLHPTRYRLVSTAMQKGYGATSVSDLLKAADVNSGSLYNFFPGKQDLLVAVPEAH
jgi:TetR/AcrR family transcriptional repressor of nem operon